MKITATRMRKAGLCESEIKRFLEHWPRGCKATIENMAEARAINFDCTSLVDLLTGWHYKEYIDFDYDDTEWDWHEHEFEDADHALLVALLQESP
jgi:hypothetical protein